jgi:membrane protein implicated in regulation of membrane protease activity
VLLATLTALLLLALVVSLVLAALAPDNPLDTFGWVVQAWLVLPLAVVVGAWWWRLLSGRRDGQDDPDVADDEPAAQRHHRSLSGEDAPPTRW